MGCPKLTYYPNPELRVVHRAEELTSEKTATKARRDYIYGFQGQEMDDETGLVNYKYRMHDPRIGRFFAVDPLSPQYPHYSPYMFSGNKVIAFIELEGLEEFSIHSASFAPFDQFGGPFSGDGDDRKFGTDPSASSRIYGSVKLDATASKIELVSTDKRGSISRNNWIGTQSYSEAKFSADVADIPVDNEGFSAASLDFDLAGNNSQIPGSPDIDVNGTFALLRQDLGDAGSRISVTGMIYGDKFPANETFLTDEFGTGVFLGVSGADGNPFTSLPGAGSSRMSTFEIYVNFDINEKITGVTYGGETYSVDDWNKKFESLDPKSGDVATEND